MRRRKDMHDLQELVRLHRLNVPTRAAARTVGMSRNTLRRYHLLLREAGLLDGAPDELPTLEALAAAAPQRVPPQQTSTAAPHAARIAELVAKRSRPAAILQRLQSENTELDVSYDAVKRLCRHLTRAAPPSADDVAIRVETPPGEVAQIDFGYVGLVVDPATGLPRKAWVFQMVLGYSRHMYARVVFDQSVSTWIDLHVRAFDWFGGAPRTLVPDNLKAAVVRAAFGLEDDPEIQRDYRELVRFYGCKVDPAPPRAPQKKGKVESGVHFANRFLATRREDADINEVNADLARWVVETAGERIHGTTRKQPLRVFLEEEKASLLPLPGARYEVITWRKVKVHQDAHVMFQRRQYSVPWQHLGAEAWVRATPSEVAVLVGDVRVSVHSRTGPGTRSTLPAHLPAHRLELAERSPEVWRERGAVLGEDVLAWVDEQLNRDTALSGLRRVQLAIVYLESLPKDRAATVCRRASAYGLGRLSELKNVVERCLDLAPLPEGIDAPAPGLVGSPRFARAIGELYLSRAEVQHGWQ